MSADGAQRSRPGRPRDPEADTAILRAAVESFIELGADRTSIENVAKRAGVAKVTVYRRWRTKEDLLAHAIESVRDDLPNVAPRLAPGVPLTEVIEQLLPRWGEALADPRFRALSVRLLAAGTGHPALLRAYRTHHVLPRRERARAIMLQAQLDQQLDPTADVDVLMDMMEGAIIQRLLLDPEPITPEDATLYLRRLLAQAGFSIPLR